MTEEIWKSIPGYSERYQVSNKGRVRSWYKNGKVKILKQENNLNGYLTLSIQTKRGKFKKVGVHRLVLYAFDSPRSDMQVNHINGIKTDNRLENLEWCTCKENVHHAQRSGLRQKTEQPKYKVLWVEENKIYESVSHLAKEVFPEMKQEVAKRGIWATCIGTYKSYKGQHFEYVGKRPNKILWVEENKVYESIPHLVREVFPETKRAGNGIRLACIGTYKTYKGQHFKYVEDEDDKQQA